MPPTDLSTRRIVQGLHTHIVGVNLTYLATVESTQDEVAALEDDDPEGCVFLTDEQTAGRGRNHRQWTTPPGSGLLLSVLLRPTAAVFPQLTMIGSLAAIEAIAQVTGIVAEIKWPNDIMIHGKKAGGVLVEGEFIGEDPRYAALGMGLNVNWDDIAVEGALYPPTSLSKELGAPVSRNELAIAVLNNLDRLYVAAGRGEPLHDAWRAHLSTLGKQVRLSLDRRVVEGLAVDVSPDGALLVQLADGHIETIYAGDVTRQAG